MYQITREEAGEKTLIPFTQLDKIEVRILGALREAGGRAYRTDLRAKIGGSNTTFMRKVESLKDKGILEEFKTRKLGGKRMKAAYSFTSSTSRLFDLKKVLEMHKWFSASEKIELFPEFDKIARALIGDEVNVYQMLGIQPQYLSIETILATSIPPSLTEEQVKELLPMINAYLQNIVTSSLHPGVQRKAEGYVIFRYKLEEPREELEQQLLAILTSYVSSSDALDQHRAIGTLTELGIKNPDLLPKLTIAATNIATALKFDAELGDLKMKYNSYSRQEEPIQLTRIQLAVSVLTIFEKLYDLYQEKGGRSGTRDEAVRNS
jgi:DNA-binding Lrp family transcriptional regulator